MPLIKQTLLLPVNPIYARKGQHQHRLKSLQLHKPERQFFFPLSPTSYNLQKLLSSRQLI